MLEKKLNIDERMEIFFDSFLDFIPDEIFLKDDERRYLRVNRAMASHLGISEPILAIGKLAEDFFPEETAEKIREEDEEILKKGKIFVREQKRMEAKGELIKWVEFTKGPLYDERNHIIGIFGIAKDITYLKETEEKDKFLINFQNTLTSAASLLVKFGLAEFHRSLKFALYKFARFLNTDFASFSVLDAEQEFVEKQVWHSKNIKLNEKLKVKIGQIYNYLMEGEFKNAVLVENDDIFPYGKVLDSKIKNLFEGKAVLFLPIIVNGEIYGGVLFYGVNSDTSKIKENFRMIEIFNEAMDNLAENFVNENARRRMEPELRKLSIAVEQSANLIVITDKNFRIEYVNPKFLEKMEIASGKYEGEKINAFWPDEENTTTFAEIVGRIREQGEWTGRVKGITKSGKEIWTNVTFSTIKDNNGKITNYLAVIEDITERMQIENQLAISQKLESIGQLAAGIAHEINTPMQYIGDNTLFVKESIDNLFYYIRNLEEMLLMSNPEQKGKIGQLKEEIDFNFISSELPLAIRQSENGIAKVDKIVKAMKNFAHPGIKGKTKADINKGISDSIIISKNEWKYCADLIFEPEENLPPVYCQLDEINQVILNMIVNAAQAIEEKLGARPSEKGKIEIRTYSEGDFAVIEIKDNGCGIPKENISKIYDPFFTTKDVGKGSGQGLSIARNIIVNKHNGIIEVDSKEGVGTLFKIKLPFEERRSDGKNSLY